MMEDNLGNAIHDYDGINYDDIPKITDFSKGRKNPFAGRFKDGYTIVVEHKDHDELIKVSKTKISKVAAQ